MHVRRSLRLPAITLCLSFFLLSTVVAGFAVEKPRIRVDDYEINAELFPTTHKLTAHAVIRFTALDDINVAVFELHNGLRPTRVVDAAGHALSVERVTQDSSVRIALPGGLSKNVSTSLTFDYEGVLASADDSPVEGLKLAYIGPETSYLLYAGRWFPLAGYGVNRFTSTINVTVPAGMKVIGSGRVQSSGTHPSGGKVTYTFNSRKPSFPGTIIAGKFEEKTTGSNVHVFLKPNHKQLAAAYAETAEKEFVYFSSLYGQPPSPLLYVVELPDDTVPSAWAPEIAAIASRGVTEKTNYRLLANAIAHQWWGVSVSPATRDDYWLQEGAARYSEVRYVENAAGSAGFEEATKDMSVGALAYDTIPLSSAGKLDPFSSEFQSLTTDKGGMIFHMLRWVVGDPAFNKTMLEFAAKFAGKPASARDLRAVAEANHQEPLTAFFTQWLDGTGAPEFHDKYSVYRVAKGFRVVGEISQDLDLFKMPLQLRIDTDGKSELQRIDVVGTHSPYAVETFGKPRRIILDPNSWVLKMSPDIKVRIAILRGQQLMAQGDFNEALKEFQKSLDSNKNSSLAHYRIAEVFLLQKNYQAAANAYREAISGDGEPRWTEVWGHIQLGKIFDLTGQRDRAVAEYRQALQTNDNTQGAQEEARKYLSTPYSKDTSKDPSTT